MLQKSHAAPTALLGSLALPWLESPVHRRANAKNVHAPCCIHCVRVCVDMEERHTRSVGRIACHECTVLTARWDSFPEAGLTEQYAKPVKCRESRKNTFPMVRDSPLGWRGGSRATSEKPFFPGLSNETFCNTMLAAYVLDYFVEAGKRERTRVMTLST